jgi:SAM-dependent methyltransferase
MHPNSKLLFQKYAKEYFQPNMRVLEIGPDLFPSSYQSIIADDSISWEGVDLYHREGLTHLATSEYTFPLPDNSFDIVVSAQVLEHVKKIWVWMKEVARVCKPGGLVIPVNPVSWPYHEAPVDCWRVYPEGMKALYEDASLDVILSTYESLELLDYIKVIPGKSPGKQPRVLKGVDWVLRRLRFPAEFAYDTITIGRK